MIFWLLLGIVIGYLFKPQIDNALQRVYKLIQENKSEPRDKPDRED